MHSGEFTSWLICDKLKETCLRWYGSPIQDINGGVEKKKSKYELIAPKEDMDDSSEDNFLKKCNLLEDFA